MKIETTQVTEIKLTELEWLDDISIIIKDYKPGDGEITITCFKKSWTAGWGAMGGQTVSQFFRSCDNGYLISNLSATPSTMPAEGVALRNGLMKTLETLELGQFKVPDAVGRIARICDFGDDRELMEAMFGPDWPRYAPHISNPEYGHMERICDAVKEGLQQMAGAVVT